MKTIDATNQKIGRVATQAAIVLMGKDKTDFARNKHGNVEVQIINASKLSIDTKKKKEKIYQSYSGYPGGQKRLTLERVIEKNGYQEVLRKAVRGMLPPNKLRAKMLVNLTIID
jgi:large subunit ribosomal protein L13